MPSPPSIEPDGYPLEDLGNTATDATPTPPSEASMPSPPSAGPQGPSPEEPSAIPAEADNDATTATPAQASTPTRESLVPQDHLLEGHDNPAPDASTPNATTSDATTAHATTADATTAVTTATDAFPTDATPTGSGEASMSSTPSSAPQRHPLQDSGNATTEVTTSTQPTVAATPEAVSTAAGNAHLQNSSNRDEVNPRKAEEGLGTGWRMAGTATPSTRGSDDSSNNVAQSTERETCLHRLSKRSPAIRWCTAHSQDVKQRLTARRVKNAEIGQSS